MPVDAVVDCVGKLGEGLSPCCVCRKTEAGSNICPVPTTAGAPPEVVVCPGTPPNAPGVTDTGALVVDTGVLDELKDVLDTGGLFEVEPMLPVPKIPTPAALVLGSISLPVEPLLVAVPELPVGVPVPVPVPTPQMSRISCFPVTTSAAFCTVPTVPLAALTTLPIGLEGSSLAI